MALQGLHRMCQRSVSVYCVRDEERSIRVLWFNEGEVRCYIVIIELINVVEEIYLDL